MNIENKSFTQTIVKYLHENSADRALEEFWQEFKPRLKANILEKLEIIALHAPEGNGITFTVKIK